MGTVRECCQLREVKDEIENKRRILNELVLKEIDRDELLRFSVELDKLIIKYYGIKSDR